MDFMLLNYLTLKILKVKTFELRVATQNKPCYSYLTTYRSFGTFLPR
jgi:hypothetical protein